MPNKNAYNRVEEILSKPHHALGLSQLSEKIYKDHSDKQEKDLTAMLAAELKSLKELEKDDPERTYPYYNHGRTLLMLAVIHRAEWALPALFEYHKDVLVTSADSSSSPHNAIGFAGEIDNPEEPYGTDPTIGASAEIERKLEAEIKKQSELKDADKTIYVDSGKVKIDETPTYHYYLYKEYAPITEEGLRTSAQLLGAKAEDAAKLNREQLEAHIRRVLLPQDHKESKDFNIGIISSAFENTKNYFQRVDLLNVLRTYGSEPTHDLVVEINRRAKIDEQPLKEFLKILTISELHKEIETKGRSSLIKVAVSLLENMSPDKIRQRIAKNYDEVKESKAGIDKNTFLSLVEILGSKNLLDKVVAPYDEKAASKHKAQLQERQVSAGRLGIFHHIGQQETKSTPASLITDDPRIKIKVGR